MFASTPLPKSISIFLPASETRYPDVAPPRAGYPPEQPKIVIFIYTYARNLSLRRADSFHRLISKSAKGNFQSQNQLVLIFYHIICQHLTQTAYQ